MVMKIDENAIALPALSTICTYCKHARSVAERTCDAFTQKQGIPLPIWLGENNHRYPYRGDHGIQFDPIDHMRPFDRGTGAATMETFKGTWTTAQINDFPDSSFLFIEAGGKKDSDGRTTPRSLRHFPYKDANGKTDLPHLRNAIARIPQSNAKGLNKQAVQKRAQKLLANANKSEGSFTVFKSGDAWRWLARTTTAYRDRDNEIITTKALEDDAERMNSTQQYGPLRYWHLGQPDPFNPKNPAGPGVDIGDCDYSIVIGRTSIESGTFKSAAIGKAFADSADEYELSPGFFHPVDQPNNQGEYDQIHRFERSVVPIKYGRASNLFTGMTVKEQRMDQQTYDARVKAFLTDMNDKGVPAEVAAGALAGMEQADKSAQQQGIAYKSDDPWQAVLAALKAAVQPPQAEPAVTEKAPPPPDAGVAGSETDENPADEGTPEDQAADEGEYLGDMNVADFETMLTSALQTALEPLVKGLDIAGKMAGHMDELKAMYGGATTKDDARAAEIAKLKEQQANLATRLNALEGDQPAIGLKDVAEALSSNGPQQPPSDTGPVVPTEPGREWAGWVVKAFPELYGGNSAPSGD